MFSWGSPPAEAESLYLEFVQRIRATGVEVATGVFGAHRGVFLENDGPVTLWLETPAASIPERNGGGAVGD